MVLRKSNTKVSEKYCRAPVLSVELFAVAWFPCILRRTILQRVYLLMKGIEYYEKTYKEITD